MAKTRSKAVAAFAREKSKMPGLVTVK